VPGRRAFIRQAAGATALLCVRGEAVEASGPPVATSGPAADSGFEGVYLFLNPDEAEFVEVLVDHMCPPDEFTPGGVDCGLAVFIDRQLGGAYGQGERLYLRGPFRAGLAEDGYQMPLTPAQFFQSGVRACNYGCVRRWGTVFAQLGPPMKESALTMIAAGGWDSEAGVHLGAWFNELIYPLFTQACFSDPVYSGNRGKVFWRLLGYPGLPAVHHRDMVTYRGKPYPGALTPRSMDDFA
jgi:gluconate 2-dehydrogenase gamma chain